MQKYDNDVSDLIDNYDENRTIYKSNINVHVLRLLPDMDLYQELIKYINKNKLKAACILSCVGSLKELNIRLASGNTFINKKENYEIISLVGCISQKRNHVHISISNDKGEAFGGHLMPNNNFVYTTAEIVIGELPELIFYEEKCEKSTWPELVIDYKNQC